ncbi:hypothetical protein C8255_24280 [filamentous cyanobacterium CCP3]|nr:hypothetical protein C8255_24280 [filamentous cyanobacterium CCP3]
MGLAMVINNDPSTELVRIETMTSFTVKTKTVIALAGLLALGTTAVGAVACAPVPDGATPGDAIESPEMPSSGGDLGQGDDALTPEVRETILQTVAADVDRPLSELRIAAAETAT